MFVPVRLVLKRLVLDFQAESNFKHPDGLLNYIGLPVFIVYYYYIRTTTRYYEVL